MKKHVHRIAAPKKYPILRKTAHYVIKVAPGPHPQRDSLPLLLVLRDLLKLTKNAKESKQLLNLRKIMVDKKVRKDPKFPVGLMDVVSMPGLNQNYRVMFDRKGKVVLTGIDQKESDLKLCKIMDKRKIAKGKIQLNLHDGRNILVDDPKYKSGDTLLITLPKQEIKKHIPFGKEMLVYIVDGTHIGEIAKISDFRPMPGSHPDRVILTASNEETFETLEKYVFIIGKDKPEISMYGEK